MEISILCKTIIYFNERVQQCAHYNMFSYIIGIDTLDCPRWGSIVIANFAIFHNEVIHTTKSSRANAKVARQYLCAVNVNVSRRNLNVATIWYGWIRTFDWNSIITSIYHGISKNYIGAWVWIKSLAKKSQQAMHAMMIQALQGGTRTEFSMKWFLHIRTHVSVWCEPRIWNSYVLSQDSIAKCWMDCPTFVILC